MGIYSRDYVREPSGGRHGWGDDTPACKWLIIITVVVFLLELVVTHPADHPEARAFGMRESYVDDWFSLSRDTLLTGQVWRLVSYAFLHDRSSLWHLLFNMLGLWWFGAEIERLYRTKEFTLFYLLSAAAAGLGFVLWQVITVPWGQPTGPVIGASGAVLAVLTLYATHYPREKIGILYGLIFIEVRWVVALYAAMDLIPVLQSLQGEHISTGIAHAAHLIGIAFALAYRRFGWHFSGWIDFSRLRQVPRRWRQSQVKKNLRVYDPEPPAPPADLESELDRILAKIHEEGSDSLTDREQSILTRASQQYKNRQ